MSNDTKHLEKNYDKSKTGVSDSNKIQNQNTTHNSKKEGFRIPKTN